MDYRHIEHRSRLRRLAFISLIAVSIGLLLALIWIDLTWRNTATTIKARDLRVKELQGEIVHLDEVLTMSALMAATSGDKQWERRYCDHEPRLTAAIAEASAIAPADGVIAAAQTGKANAQLVALERKAFAAVQNGDIASAKATLMSPEYVKQKQAYASGMAALDAALQAFIGASKASMHRSGQAHLALNLGAVVIVVLGWATFFRTQLKSEKELIANHGKLRQLAGELSHANNVLELRAEELAHANADLAESNLHLSTEIETRIRAESAQKDLHMKLLAATRQAGMAEIATGVLHNVGNALNSVNVAATVAIDLVRGSRVGDLTRATDLLSEHSEDLPDFLTTHPRGKLMLRYLRELAVNLRSEQGSLLDNLEHLCKKVDHTKQIVKSQQTYARVTELDTEIDLEEIVTDVLETLGGSLKEHSIELFCDRHEVPAIQSDKHKVMQILANLVTNAIHALLSSSHLPKCLTVRLGCDGEHRAFIEVEDTGIGIDATHLTKIFQYGFTTKQTGHGFGLHHSALVARELGGDLRVHSDGVGRGAKFTLELPISRDVELAPSELMAV